ncbi:hypothetical protein RS030_213394 [Cryptosporidium xiaoi]|uniref:Uncharacterized protein n=1 Tax=Cryptosporidium xiaoi TaxID=659607 RepID=A0AAV9XWW6_9CRYT
MEELDVKFNNLVGEEIEIESWVTCSMFSEQGEFSKEVSSSFTTNERCESGVIPALRENITKSINKERRKKKNIGIKMNRETINIYSNSAPKGRSCSILQSKNRKRI